MSSWRITLLAGLCACLGCASDAPDVLVLVNEIDLARRDEPVVIHRSELESHLGPIPPGLVPLCIPEGQSAVPGQIDDVDGDGLWDEWALLLSFGPEEALRAHVSLHDSAGIPRFRARTNVRVDGGTAGSGIWSPRAVAWENDIVGFRLALDRPAGKQMVGKITSEMVLDSMAAVGRPNEMSLWGMDILNVRTSLGAGALASWSERRPVRLDVGAETPFRLITEGPTRSIFEVAYTESETGSRITERITIWAGRSGFESAVSMSGSTAEEDILAGIAHARSDTMYEWSWETPLAAIAAHGEVGDGAGKIGLALLYPADYSEGVGSMEDSAFDHSKTITDSYYVRLRVPADQPSTHFVYAVWEQQNYIWANRSSFERLLRDEARRLASPIRVR